MSASEWAPEGSARFWVVTVAAAAVYEAIGALPAARVHSVLRAHRGVRAVHRFDFKSTLHSLLIGTAAAAAIAADDGLGFAWRVYECTPGSGAIAWALPPMEAGYAVGELLTMLPKRDWQYVGHSVLVLVCLLTTRAFGVVTHLPKLLVIHVSTVFLNCRGLDLGPMANAAIDVAFAASFFALRLLLLPLWWVQFLAAGATTDAIAASACVSPAMYAFVVVSGVLLHGLNLYWGVLIAVKLRDKLRDGSLKRQTPEKNG